MALTEHESSIEVNYSTDRAFDIMKEMKDHMFYNNYGFILSDIQERPKTLTFKTNTSLKIATIIVSLNEHSEKGAIITFISTNVDKMNKLILAILQGFKEYDNYECLNVEGKFEKHKKIPNKANNNLKNKSANFNDYIVLILKITALVIAIFGIIGSLSISDYKVKVPREADEIDKKYDDDWASKTYYTDETVTNWGIAFSGFIGTAAFSILFYGIGSGIEATLENRKMIQDIYTHIDKNVN